MTTDWNRFRYRPDSGAGHYESYYLRANHPREPRALWLRYTVFSPRGRPADAIGEIWAIAFDGASRRHVAVKQEFPFADCSFASGQLGVRIGEGMLDAQSLRGSAASGGRRLAWDLRYGGGQAPLLLMAPAKYQGSFPAAKSLVAQPLARFEGWLEVDGARWDIGGWPGSQNHNWGTRHTDRYAFGQVAGFDGAPDSFLEVATARVRLGPLLTPPFTPMVLRHDGREHHFTGMLQALRARGRYRDFRWSFASAGGPGRIEGEISAAPDAFVGLRYYNPPGGVKICLNTKIAACRLRLRHGDGRTEELHSRHGALFEILSDEGDPRVAVSA